MQSVGEERKKRLCPMSLQRGLADRGELSFACSIGHNSPPSLPLNKSNFGKIDITRHVLEANLCPRGDEGTSEPDFAVRVA